MTDANCHQPPLLDVPPAMRRSRARGKPLEERMDRAVELLDKVKALTGRDDLADTRFLDIGCGDRITTALINRDIPIREYHGVDVNRDVIEYFGRHVRRPGFSYAHIDAYNRMYNETGEALSADMDIGARRRRFDLIGLFSVFTHLAPEDWPPMLELAHRHAAPDARLVFTAFVRDEQEADFVDEVPEKPLLRAGYSREAFDRFIARSGWRLTHISASLLIAPRWIVCAPDANAGRDRK